MRKVTMLTLMTVALLTGGCNRGWPRWLCRGDDCTTSSPCGPYGDGAGTSMMSPTYGPTYMPSYTSPTPELPGPVTTIAPQG